MPTEQLHERWIVELERGGRREFDERHVFGDRASAMAFYAEKRQYSEAKVTLEVIHVIKP